MFFFSCYNFNHKLVSVNVLSQFCYTALSRYFNHKPGFKLVLVNILSPICYTVLPLFSFRIFKKTSTFREISIINYHPLIISLDIASL